MMRILLNLFALGLAGCVVGPLPVPEPAGDPELAPARIQVNASLAQVVVVGEAGAVFRPHDEHVEGDRVRALVLGDSVRMGEASVRADGSFELVVDGPLTLPDRLRVQVLGSLEYGLPLDLDIDDGVSGVRAPSDAGRACLVGSELTFFPCSLLGPGEACGHEWVLENGCESQATVVDVSVRHGRARTEHLALPAPISAGGRWAVQLSLRAEAVGYVDDVVRVEFELDGESIVAFGSIGVTALGD